MLPVMNASWTETSLNDLESTTLACDNVRDWHLDIRELDLAMSLWCIIISKHRHGSDDLNTWCIRIHNHDRLLSVLTLIVRITFAHDQIDLAAWIASTRDPPFVTIDDIMISYTFDPGFNVGRI